MVIAAQDNCGSGHRGHCWKRGTTQAATRKDGASGARPAIYHPSSAPLCMISPVQAQEPPLELQERVVTELIQGSILAMWEVIKQQASGRDHTKAMRIAAVPMLLLCLLSFQSSHAATRDCMGAGVHPRARDP